MFEFITLIAVWVALTLFVGINVSEWVTNKVIEYSSRDNHLQQQTERE